MPPVEQSKAAGELPEDFAARLRVSVPGYRLLRVLGRGGQATVYQAVDAATAQVVAIKVLHDGPFAAQAARARLRKEIFALKALDHPGIVRILGDGQTESGHDFLLMEFVDGCSLDEFWKSRAIAAGDAAPRELLSLFAAICSIVGYAHRSGVTHRDLSPSNIRIDSVGQPRILDFGLARTAFDSLLVPGAVTSSGQFLGKLFYASPEQVAGDPSKIDIRCDVYALGILLFQMLTGGQFPYEVSGSPAQILHNISHTPPRFPGGPGSGAAIPGRKIEPHLSAIIRKSLEKDPARRFQSAAEMGHAIEAHLAGHRVPFAAYRPGRRFNWRSAVAAALLTAIAVVAAFIIHRRMNPPLVPKSAAMAVNFLVPLSQSNRLFTTNSLGLKFIPIAAGNFMMGTPVSDQSPGSVNGPAPRKVTITKPFLMQVTHVTRGQFATFANATGYKTDDERLGGLVYNDTSGLPAGRDPTKSWRDPGFPQRDDHPVVAVTWNDAIAFAAWLSKKEGKNYSLPTEAEWEYAARAGTRTPYFWGTLAQFGKGYGNTIAPTWNDGFEYTSPVGTFKPNPWGLYDMTGNAWEWCSDFFTSAGSSEQADPTGAPPTMMRHYHPLRGGSFGSDYRAFRVDARFGYPADCAGEALGFRLVIDSRPFAVPAPPEQPPATPPTAVDADSSFRSPARINLLALVDTDRDSRHAGGWKFDGDAVVSTGPTQQLEFPYAPPEEYDFQMAFTPPQIILANLQFFFPPAAMKMTGMSVSTTTPAPGSKCPPTKKT